MRRREFIAFVAGATVWPLAAQGQQKAPRTVGVLGFGPLEVVRKGFGTAQRRLAEMGYVEGQNLAIEYRSADSHQERLAGLAADLVRRRVDVIYAPSGMATVAAKAATTSIPIIFLAGLDPVASGFVASMNQPGGNVTGISILDLDVAVKRLGILCELVPTAKSIGVLYGEQTNLPGADLYAKGLESAADSLSVKLLFVGVQRTDDFEEAFARIASTSDALYILTTTLLVNNRQALVGLAARYKMPASYPDGQFVAAGGLVSYGTNYSEAYGRVGDYLGRVLNGEKPENLPVMQVTKLDLLINIKTAKSLGLTIPPTLLARADEVIE
jgi:putative ABC transport system substrate-binding protein